jgi:hypothetical protein
MARFQNPDKKADPARKVLAPRSYSTHSHHVQKVVPPALYKKRRVYRLGNGLVSLNKTPEDLIYVCVFWSCSESSQILASRLTICSARANALSPLLQLPAEIRNRIFEYALGGYEIKIRQKKKKAFLAPKTRTEHLKAPNRIYRTYISRIRDLHTG